MKLRLFALSVTAAAAAALIVTVGASPAAARDGCPAIGNVGSYHVYGLNAHAISCEHARHLAIENLAHHRRHTYHCTHSLRGSRDVHMHCVDLDNTLRQYTVLYRVH
jgi:hypothetical protein